MILIQYFSSHKRSHVHLKVVGYGWWKIAGRLQLDLGNKSKVNLEKIVFVAIY
jgi:hypothetical protein